jgi:hypothetical protein
MAAAVDRTQGLTFTWVGGNPGTYVILGGSSTAAGVTVAFTCRVGADLGEFTLPSYILLGLPTGAGSTTIQGAWAWDWGEPSGFPTNSRFLRNPETAPESPY